MIHVSNHTIVIGAMQEVVTRNITFRIYPSRKQEDTLLSWLELHRKLYNAALWEKRQHYRLTGEHLPYRSQQNHFLMWWKEAHPECKALGSHALQETVRRVDRAFKGFYARIEKGLPAGLPRFKGKNRLKSFTYPDPAGWKYLGGIGRTHRIRVTNLGILRARGMPRVAIEEGRPRCLTIRRRQGRWYATVTVRYQMEALERERRGYLEAGLDPGSHDLVTLSDGTRYEAPKSLEKNLTRLKSLQRDLSRKEKGSNRYRKARKRVARLHEKVANQRKDHLHKLSALLVVMYVYLAVEKMELAKLTRSINCNKAKLNRHILDAGIAMFVSMLAYKAEEAGGHCVEVRPDAENAFTRRCSGCGADVPKSLYQRWHRCKHCGLELDRDVNAALNVLEHAKRLEAGPASAWRGGPPPQ